VRKRNIIVREIVLQDQSKSKQTYCHGSIKVQRTQNDLFVRLRGRVYETREQKSYICNNRTNYEIFQRGPFSIESKRLFDYNINRQFRTAEYRLAHEEGSM